VSAYIQQQFSGKILRVVSESPHWLVLRPVPDDDGPDIGISRDHYNMKWKPYQGAIPTEPQREIAFVFGEKADDVPEPDRLHVEKRKRGRPAGSKNKPREAVTA
jgi:hypothetical protein